MIMNPATSINLYIPNWIIYSLIIIGATSKQPTAPPTALSQPPTRTTTAISGETLVFYDSMDDYAANWTDGDSKCYQWSTFYDSQYTSATELCSADTYRCCLITVHLSENSKAGYIERTIHQLEEYNAFYIEYDLYIRDNMVTSNDAPPAYAILEYNFTSDTDYIQLEALTYINNGTNVFRPKPTPIFYNNNADSSLTLRFRNNGTTFNDWQEYSVDNVYLYGFLPTLAPIISPILSPTLYPSAASNSTFSPSIDSTNNPLKSTFVASITTTRNRTKSSSSSQNSTNITIIEAFITTEASNSVKRDRYAQYIILIIILSIITSLLIVFFVELARKEDDCVVFDEGHDSDNITTQKVIAYKKAHTNDLDHITTQKLKVNKEAHTNDLDHITQKVKVNKLAQAKALDLQYWLQNVVQLPQYYDVFMKNGYESIQIVREISDVTELTEIGINSSDHQTKILYEIAELKQWKEGDESFVTQEGN